MFAEAQKLSPVIAAKFDVKLVRNSTKLSIQSRQARIKIEMMPWRWLLPALFAAVRSIRMMATMRPEKHTVPKEGPNAFLQSKHRCLWVVSILVYLPIYMCVCIHILVTNTQGGIFWRKSYGYLPQGLLGSANSGRTRRGKVPLSNCAADSEKLKLDRDHQCPQRGKPCRWKKFFQRRSTPHFLPLWMQGRMTKTWKDTMLYESKMLTLQVPKLSLNGAHKESDHHLPHASHQLHQLPRLVGTEFYLIKSFGHDCVKIWIPICAHIPESERRGGQQWFNSLEKH